jgi:hypothetical protein
MRYNLRSLFRRWKVRIAYLMACPPAPDRSKDELIRPRLILLENRTLPSGMASLLASFNAGGTVTTSRAADSTNSNTGIAVTNSPATAALTFTASGTAGAITVNSRVFADTNRNGVLDAGEAGVANAQIQLFDDSGTLLGTATSDANGNFSFSSAAGASSSSAVFNTQLQSGALYQLRAQSSAATAIGLVVSPSQSNATKSKNSGTSFGALTAIGGAVFTDTNGNGIHDAAETGVGNVTVNLFDSSNTFVSSTSTANDGSYSFSVAPGTYTVVFDSTTLPTGSVFTTQHAPGSNANNDSDANTITGRSDPITVGIGNVINNIDAGIYTPVVIGDFAWNDANGNGIQDPGEGGKAGVIVNLLDNNGNVVQTQTTTGNGLYQFSAAPGIYQVEFVAPAGSNFSPKSQGADPTKDSDADPVTGRTALIAFNSGDVNEDLDAGITTAAPPATGSIGDFVFFDANGNGIQDPGEIGLPNVKINLLDGNGNFITTTTPDGFGKYSFTGLAAGNYIVEFVPTASFFSITAQHQGVDPKADSDPDPVTGRTGVITLAAGQSNNDIDCGLIKPTSAMVGDFVWNDTNGNGIQDPGEVGVPNVTVNLLDSNGKFVTTTTTDANGKYLFLNVAAGDYQVEFIAPAGFNFTKQNQGSDVTVDSDPDPVTGRTAVFSLADSQQDLTRDAGLTQAVPLTSSIGDFVFFDQNLNGIQDPGEFGVPNQVVNLLDGNGNFIATTTTDSFGKYLFTGLAAGNYIIEIVTSPAGWFFSPAHQGTDPKLDSDITSSVGGTGRTDVIALPAGTNDLDEDIGLTKPTAALLGDFVWHDLNCNGIQDAGEPGFANVTVNLLDANGNVVQTATTDANGKYLFSGLTPGTYSVMFVLPSGFTFSPVHVGSDNTVDSDADPINGKTQQVSLVAGQADMTLDAGICTPMAPPPSSIRGKVYHDLNNDGIPEPNEPGIAGAKITLTGTDDTGAFVMRMVFSGPDGTYEFTGLKPGTYTVAETQPPNFLDGKDRAGSAGGISGNDITTNIPIAAGVDAFNYDFGERLTGTSNGGKEGLLASTGHTPTLADQAVAMPTSPTYGNAVSATMLASTAPPRYVVTGADFGSAPIIRVYDFATGVNKFTIMAYDPSFRGGVRVAVGDVTGDGVPDIITAAGESGGPHIKVFDGVTGHLVSQFFAYSASFTGGVYVAVGDVNGTGVDQIITGAGEGGGPHVRVFGLGGNILREFFAYDASFRGGVRVAAGDVNGDGKADIITGAGPGGGPHVKVFSGDPSLGVLSQAFVYDASFTGGVYVAAGDTNGDGKSEVITGGGAGPAQKVRVFNGLTFAEVYSFYAYSSTFTGGTRVGALDIDGNGKDEVLTTPGAGIPGYTEAKDVDRGANAENFLADDPANLGGFYVAGGK